MSTSSMAPRLATARGSTLVGMPAMLRIAWRRNRWFWILWVLGLSALLPMTVRQYDTLIPPGTDPAEVVGPLASNPTMLAMLGPAYDLLDKGGFVFWRVGGFTAVMAAMMAGFGIIRATRAEEEEGRVEIVRSGPIGRHAPLAVSLIVALGGCAALGLLTTFALVAAGLAVPGSVASGVALGLTGAQFAGLGAVAAQVFETARTARAWTLGLGLGGMYLLRAIVDARGADAPLHWLQWVIPVEWGMLSRPFADERWAVFLLPTALTVLSGLVAFRLESARDHGSGLRPAGLGPRTAPAYLGSAWGLASRLQRVAVLSWSVGILLCGYAFGSLGSQLESDFAKDPNLTQMLEKMGGTSALGTGFNVVILAILATVVLAMAVSLLGRLRAEESRGTTELMLATAAGRAAYASSHLVLALLFPAGVLVFTGGLIGLASGDGRLGSYAAAGAALLPGLALTVGLAMALIGWAPRWYGVAWALVGWTIFTTWFAALFDIPKTLIDLQPWGHLAHLPRDEMSWGVFVIELAIGAVLLVLGLMGYRHRDIEGH